MDQQEIQTRVQVFAQRLLSEAKGDPVRALGLLVLVLEEVNTEDMKMVRKLITEVRRILVPASTPVVFEPDSNRQIAEPPIQHLAGELSWEGVQHCIRCGKVLAKAGEPECDGYPSGYVYQVGDTFFLGDPEDCHICNETLPR